MTSPTPSLSPDVAQAKAAQGNGNGKAAAAKKGNGAGAKGNGDDKPLSMDEALQKGKQHLGMTEPAGTA